MLCSALIWKNNPVQQKVHIDSNYGIQTEKGSVFTAITEVNFFFSFFYFVWRQVYMLPYSQIILIKNDFYCVSKVHVICSRKHENLSPELSVCYIM